MLEEADLVVSLFTLQFLSVPERMKVLRGVYECLRSGGALIMAEKLLAEEGRFDDMWVELYWDFKKRQGLTDDQILHKARSIRGVLRPIALTENIRLLRDSGFNSIDLFLKWYNYAGILAIKTTSSLIKFTGYEAVADAVDGTTSEGESILKGNHAGE